MSPQVLIVGGEKGSRQIRGVQMGRALHAQVSSDPTPEQWAAADVVVLLKRAIDRFGEQVERTPALVIWDVLDYWQQPEENHLSEADMVRQVQAKRQQVGVDLVIGATQAMATAIGGVYLPHHSRPSLVPRPVRATLLVIAYEGTPKYLGQWRTALERVCARMGLEFVVNPEDLGAADLVVGFRDQPWDGPICRAWKSGVKYVNAVAAGRPMLTQGHAAFTEIGGPGTFVIAPCDLEWAIEKWRPLDVRIEAYRQSLALAKSYTLHSVADQYRQVITEALRRAA